MHDILIMGGTAVIGGLIIDLQKRLSAKQQIMAGMCLLTLGWIATLCMTASGPFPMPMGAAIGSGLFLCGVVLFVTPAFRAYRKRHDTGRGRNA